MDDLDLMSELSSRTTNEYLSAPTSPESSTASYRSSIVPNFAKLPDRRAALYDALPKDVFRMLGSGTLWRDLISSDSSNRSDEEVKAIYKKIQSYSAAKKYAFAGLLVKHGAKNALTMEPVIDESVQVCDLHPPLIKKRKFADACVQTSSEPESVSVIENIST